MPCYRSLQQVQYTLCNLQADNKRILGGQLFIGCDGEVDEETASPIEVEDSSGRFLPMSFTNSSEQDLIERNVRVGWRGPMIFESDLATIPDVYLLHPPVPASLTTSVVLN